MNKYEEIIQLRRELKRPSVFTHNHVQIRMLIWNITIGASITFKRLMDIVLSVVSNKNYCFASG